jgi:hypothetical protein
MFNGESIDLVYNRVTDFALDRPEHRALREAYREGAVVVTPNPHNHALLADKRNLSLLSNQALLESWGVEPSVRNRLKAVPRTVTVTRANADALWTSRKDLLPTGGHGGKAVYRGDKVTKGVWAEIARGGYIAQDLVHPSERMIRVDGVDQTRKMDVSALYLCRPDAPGSSTPLSRSDYRLQDTWRWICAGIPDVTVYAWTARSRSSLVASPVLARSCNRSFWSNGLASTEQSYNAGHHHALSRAFLGS